MQQLAANYLASNPGSTVGVRGYGHRPLLDISPAPPPSGSGGATSTSSRGTRPSGRSRTFSFVEAVTSLPAILSDESLAKVFKIVGTHHPGELRQMFVILNDDDRDRCQELARQPRGPRVHPTSGSSALVTSGFTSGDWSVESVGSAFASDGAASAST